MTYGELKDRLYGLVAEYFAALDARGGLVWGKTKPVRPDGPMVSLSLGQVKRPYLPMRRTVGGIALDSYPCSAALKVELFAKGAPTSDETGMAARNENTDVCDLAGFADFLNSEYADSWRAETGIALKANRVQDLTSLVGQTSWQYRALLEIDVGFMHHAAGHSAGNFEGGIPLHPNGRPKYDRETGMPLYDNGLPMYCAEGSPLGPCGERLPGGETPPLPPPPKNGGGTPLIPPKTPDSSGGGSQALADMETGYFAEVEGPTDAGPPAARHKQTKEAPRYG